jgi:4'-phosphopantetheinyl transferase
MANEWSVIHGFPSLDDKEVHLWRIDLANAAGLAGSCASLLSSSEQADANRRRLGLVRDRFTIGRACMRLLIGNALQIDPRSVTIAKGPHGKPELPSLQEPAISFNLAHSEDTLLFALRRQGAIGVDVEYFDRSTDIMEVAQANFTSKESDSLAAIADDHTRLRTFYRYWTRKEAIGKADGRGLLLPLASSEVSCESMNSHPVRIDESPDGESKLYFVSDLDVGDKAAAAIALESSDSPIRTFIFPLQSLRQ